MADTIRSYLQKKLRVTVSDGRVLFGKLLCTDRDRNLVVSSCLEYMGPPESEVEEEPRLIGMATIPGEHIVKIELREGDDGEEDEFPVSILRTDERKGNDGQGGVGQDRKQTPGVSTDGTEDVDSDRTAADTNVVTES